MRVVILCPRRAGVEDRDRLWAFARTWWENDYPEWPVVEGHHHRGPFNRSHAINAASDLADAGGRWDIAVIIDADVLADPDTIRSAVNVAAGTGQMVLAYDERVHLNAKGTEKVMAGYDGDWRERSLVEATYRDSCSSAVVVRRDLWDTVHGFDECFAGWGWEDVAFRIACETLGPGPLIKLSAPIFHLRHQTSHENNRRSPTLAMNRERAGRYKRAHRKDTTAIEALLAEADEARAANRRPAEPLTPTRIPRILHRTIPAKVDAQADAWWNHFQQLHPGWEFRTWQDPLDPADWPETGDLFDRVKGAQLAGLVRLEALYKHGGVYVDSDVEPYRSLEPLLHLPAFAAWQDPKIVPDAILGAEAGHPAFRLMLDRAREVIETGGDPHQSGPDITTEVLPGRADVLVLPPGSLYPYHFTETHRRGEDHAGEQPWAFAAHHWNGSWLTPAQKRANQRRRRR